MKPSSLDPGQVWEATWSSFEGDFDVFLVLGSYENGEHARLLNLMDGYMDVASTAAILKSKHWRRIA